MPLNSLLRLQGVGRLASSGLIPKTSSDAGYKIASEFFNEIAYFRFGYETIGSVTLSGVTDSATLGGRFTCPTDGDLTSITVRTNIGASGTATFRVAIFSNGAGDTIGSLIASSSPINVTNTTAQWIDVPITASVTSGQDYWLFAWGDASGFSSDFTYYADANAISNTIVTSFGNSYPDWSTVGDGVNENYDMGYMSICATVTTVSSSTISGISNGVASVSGSIGAKGQLVGATNSASTTSGVLSGKSYLIGTSSGTSTTSATLTPRTYIIGSVSGSSSVSGQIIGRTQLIGQSSGVGSVSATIKGKTSLIGSSIGQSVTSGQIKGYAYIQGSASGSSTASVNLNSRISGSISSTSSVSGAIYGKGSLIGVTLGQSNVSATIKAKGQLIGLVDGLSQVSGTIKAYASISGSINGSTNISGNLIGRVNILGSVSSTSSAVGTLIESNANIGESNFIIYQLSQLESSFIISNPIKESNFIIANIQNQSTFVIHNTLMVESNFIIWQQ